MSAFASSVQLRLASLTDVDALFTIRLAVTDNVLTRPQLADLGITPESIAEWIAAEACAWVMEVGGEVVGFSLVDLEAGEVFALFVRPDWQGQGFGTRLLAAAEAALFRHHALIWLITDGTHSVGANAFYRAQGWRLVAQLEGTDVRYEKVRSLERDVNDIS